MFEGVLAYFSLKKIEYLMNTSKVDEIKERTKSQ